MMASANLELGFRTPTQLNHFIVVPVMQTYKTVGCQPTGSMMASANLELGFELQPSSTIS